MARRPISRTNINLGPGTQVADLAKSTLLDSLLGSELIVLIRLVGLMREQKSKRVRAINAQLYRDGKTAVRALTGLAEMGLIKIRNYGSITRTIEVLP